MSAARGRVFIAVLGLVWAGALVAQPVYKWVDAQGQTHYGSQLPPQQADASQLKVSANGSSGAGAGRFGEQRNTDGTKKLPKEAQELVDGLTKGLKKVDGKEVPLNCALAVDNIRSQIETMLDNGQKNLKGGYITRSSGRPENGVHAIQMELAMRSSLAMRRNCPENAAQPSSKTTDQSTRCASTSAEGTAESAWK